MGISNHSARIFCAVLAITAVTFGAFDEHELTIGNPAGENDDYAKKVEPFFFATNDAAGYSDWIYYGPSDIHEVAAHHEVLSGEWAAAIYYNGISTALTADPNDAADKRQAMWLTKGFEYPYWPTTNNFSFGGTCLATENPNNPTPLKDTGRSVIYNDEVEITIDYEVVDMNSIAVGSPRSPMGYIVDPNGTISYMPSDRYIFLQTYTIKNLKATTLTGLEFYQFLHSHGANEYEPRVNSTYTDHSFSDPLSSYTPYDSVHTTGNFRYDITQWNNRPFGTESSVDHVDFVSFSSTVEPDWIDSSYFRRGHSQGSTPEFTEGGYMNIKDRCPNDANSIYNDEVTGSMGWSLGSLDPNETASMTVAFMFAPEQEAPDLTLGKTIEDPNTCYNPGDAFTYKIEWENTGTEDAEDAVLTDYLPAGLSYPITYSLQNGQMVPSDPNYGINGQHTYTWNLGTIEAGTGGSVTLSVLVNEKAPPGMTVDNQVVLETSIGKATAFHHTPICCWDDSGIIFVDENAVGANSGLNWTDAYTDLQDGLARARAACWSSTEIRVARGVYDPGRLETTVFSIPDDTSVYGGYRGGTPNGNDRNPDIFVTVLTGDADGGSNKIIVSMGDDTTLDGFTVTDATEYGVYGKDADFTIENCKIENSGKDGLYAKDGSIVVKWCKIENNGWDGIYHEGIGYTVTVEYCHINKHRFHGIFSQNSTLTAKNSIISQSGFSDNTFYGIRLLNPTNTPILYNCTIVCNANEGLSWVDDHDSTGDPNNLDYPNIQSCILYFNNDTGDQVAGFNQDNCADYCCISDCNEVNDNFNDVPGFAYTIDPNGTPDPNNFHLAWNSPCKDTGNPAHDSGDVGDYDIDGEDRICYGRVDVGADEIYACNGNGNDDIYNSLDWNADGLVNLYEYSLFSQAWLSHDPNDPAVLDPNDPVNDPNNSAYIDPNRMEGWYEWEYICNLDDTAGTDTEYEIDLADLDIFWNDWLWIACWKQSRIDRFDNMAAAMSGGSESMMVAVPMMSAASIESADDNFALLDPAEAFVQTVKLSEMNTMDKSLVQILAVLDEELKTTKKKEAENLLDMKAFLEDCLAGIRLQK